MKAKQVNYQSNNAKWNAMITRMHWVYGYAIHELAAKYPEIPIDVIRRCCMKPPLAWEKRKYSAEQAIQTGDLPVFLGRKREPYYESEDEMMNRVEIEWSPNERKIVNERVYISGEPLRVW